MFRAEKRPDSEVWGEARWQEEDEFSAVDAAVDRRHRCHGELELAGPC